MELMITRLQMLQFSHENCCFSDKWTADVKSALDASEFKGKVKDQYLDDETSAYYRRGFECFSFCLPTKGEMHSNLGLKTRVSTYDKYIEALNIVANV